MEQFVIDVEARVQVGSAAARRVRKGGLIPSVVYSKGGDAKSVTVKEREFVRLASQSRSSRVFTLRSSDGELNGKPAIVKQIQRDFQSGAVVHVDLQSLRENEAIAIRVPLEVVGEAPGVKNDGGILTSVYHDIGVKCLPRLIPEFVTVDVSSLRLGQSFHARDLTLAEGVSLVDDPDETLVSVVAVRQVEEEASGPGAAAAAEGAAPAAAAAAPAAEAAKEGAKK